MKFDRLFNLIPEATFRKSKYLTHLADFPMFSFFVHNNILEDPDTVFTKEVFNEMIPELKKLAADVKKQIGQIGLPSMHANVVINRVNDNINSNTGETGVGGYAHYSRKYITIDLENLTKFDQHTTNLLTHEWGHLWMFNNSKQFKSAVKNYYQQILQKALTTPTITNDWKEPPFVADATKSWARTFDYLPLNEYINIFLLKIIFKNKKLLTTDIIAQLTMTGQLWPYQMQLDEKDKYNADVLAAIISKEQKPESKKIIFEINKLLADIYQKIVWAQFNQKNLTTEEKEMIKDWSQKYVWKALQAFQNKPATLILVLKNKRIYDALWVNNKIKPDNVSLSKTLTAKWSKKQISEISNLEGKDAAQLKKLVSMVAAWPNVYGMSNEDEMWATAMEQFTKLPPNHRSQIIQLINQNK